MKRIAIEQLQAGSFYWACRRRTQSAGVAETHDVEIVRISTVFGSEPEFWTVAVTGSEEHFDLEAYDFLHKVAAPSAVADKRASLSLVSSFGRNAGH